MGGITSGAEDVALIYDGTTNDLKGIFTESDYIDVSTSTSTNTSTNTSALVV